MPTNPPTWEDTIDEIPSWEDTIDDQPSPLAQSLSQEPTLSPEAAAVFSSQNPIAARQLGMFVPDQGEEEGFGKALWNQSSEPFFNLPRSNPLDENSTIDKIASGVANAGIGVVEGIASPLGIATLPLGLASKGIQRLAGLGFSGLATKGAAELAGEATAIPGEIDIQKLAEAGTYGVMAPFLARPAVKMGEVAPKVEPVKPAVEPPAVAEKPTPATEPSAVPVVESVAGVPQGTVRLYQGSGAAEGAGTGGAFWTQNLDRAATYGNKIQYVDVPADVARLAQEQAKKSGSGTGGDAVLPAEWSKQAKPFDKPVEQKVYELTEEAPQNLRETVESMPADKFFDQASEWSKAAVADKTGQTLSLQRLAEKAALDNPDLALWKKGYENAQADAARIKSEIQADPKSIMTRQKEMMGAAQKAQFFQEGIKQLEKPKEVPVEAVKPEISPEDLKMRSLSERGTTSEKIPESVQKKIATAPESFYERQGLKGVEAESKAKTDAELSASTPESPTYTSDRLELSTRLFDSGKSEAAYQVFQDLSAQLTRMGQVINQAKLFNALRPEHVVSVVNKELARSDRDPLTVSQAERLQKLSKGRIEGQKAVDKATDEWVKNPTDENAAKAEKALMDANKSALEEQKMVHNFQHKSTASLLKSILQGNLLTPISQVANVVGNVNFAPFRAASRGVASGIDVIDSYIRNRPRQVSVGGNKDAVGGLIKGVKQIPSILAHGPGDVIKGEARAGMQPVKAWIKQFAKNPDMPTKDGKIALLDRLNLAIEGTFGVPAEIMLRGLSAGDIAPREAARARLISEQSRLSNLTPSQKKMAQNFPELFFDNETLARIENETRGALFQGSSSALDHFMSWTKSKGDGFDLLVSTIAPYKLTPWNIVGEILSYNPLVAAAKTVMESKRGNIRSAEMNAGKLVVGSMLVAAGSWLYSKGLLAPSMDSRDEQQKARILAGEVLPPNHINISGLKRAMEGKDPSFKPGDKTIDIFRAGGLAGSMFYMMANIGRDMETKPETKSQLLSVLKNSTLEQARFGLNQSFLKGVTGLLDAVQNGETDGYLQQYANTVMSMALPNTLSALSRADREYKVDLKDDNVFKELGNAVKNRLGVFGLDDYLPLKRDLWGKPMRERPEGANALAYELFDITKGKQVTDDPVPLELYRLWRKTANTSVIPSIPEKVFTFQKSDYVLNPEQRSRLSELVGQKRRDIIDKIVINPKYHELNDEEKIKILDSVYRKGSELGKSIFWQEQGENLTEKPKRKAFNGTSYQTN